MSKIEQFWENATAEDVMRVVEGERVEARFWDDEHRGKFVGLLVGWTAGEPCWYCETACARTYFENCQVYREPSWHANKPDPGPGYRLLGKMPDEELKPGDEAWNVWNDNQWRMSDSANGGMPQGMGIWYRRRIEVEPEPNHCILRVGYTATLPNGQTITATEKGFEVT
jgi:hypothetical protein